MVWVIACLLGSAVMLLLRASGKCSRAALELAGVAVLIALAGYSWQGSPEMAGHPVITPPAP